MKFVLVWLISFSTVTSDHRFHFAVLSQFFRAESKSTASRYLIFFVHSLAEGRLRRFHVLATTNNAGLCTDMLELLQCVDFIPWLCTQMWPS